MKATQEMIEANTKSMREDIRTGQAEIRSIVGAFQEKLDACLASRRDDEKENVLPRNDGGTSGMRGANLSNHGI
jgi:hypothetical protein